MINRRSEMIVLAICEIIFRCGSFNFSPRRNCPECATERRHVAILPRGKSFADAMSISGLGGYNGGMPSVCVACATLGQPTPT
jgi:hypothetical protein